jgi:hypothetical protein
MVFQDIEQHQIATFVDFVSRHSYYRNMVLQTTIIPFFAPLAQAFAAVLTASLTGSMYYMIASPKGEPRYTSFLLTVLPLDAVIQNAQFAFDKGLLETSSCFLTLLRVVQIRLMSLLQWQPTNMVGTTEETLRSELQVRELVFPSCHMYNVDLRGVEGNVFVILLKLASRSLIRVSSEKILNGFCGDMCSLV